MTSRSRAIIFFSLLFVFVVSAPLIVLYTAGYRYSWVQDRIVQTGLLSLASLPRDAEILINGEPVRKRTPATIDNIPPGKHTLALSKQGYLPWQQTVRIFSRQTTFLKQIVLFLDAPVVRATLPEELTKPYAWPKQNEGTLFAHAVLDRTAISRAQSGRITIVAYLPSGQYRFLDAPPGFIFVQKSNGEEIYLIDEQREDSPILLEAHARLYAWEKKVLPRLLYSDGFDLHVYDPASHQDNTLTRVGSALTGLAWHPLGSVIFFTQSDRLDALELYEDEGTHNRVTLAQGKDLSDIHVDEKGRTVYFTGTLDGTTGWFVRKLIE